MYKYSIIGLVLHYVDHAIDYTYETAYRDAVNISGLVRDSVNVVNKDTAVDLTKFSFRNEYGYPSGPFYYIPGQP